MTALNTVLANLEAAIRAERFEPPEPMCGDRWIGASAMQKAIRRGHFETALHAATALWLQDRQNFWRRLHIIALEDVGIGSPENVAAVLTATDTSAFRRRIGDLRVGLYLVRLLCGSVKSRAADELLLWLEHGACHRPMQKRLAKASDTVLAEYVADEREPLAVRATALWYLGGTVKFGSDNLPARKGSYEAAAAAIRALKNVPTELAEGCISVMPRTEWALSLFVPLLQQEVSKQQVVVKQETLPALKTCEEIPLVSLDMYTMTGNTAFRRLQREVKELQRCSVRQLGIATFFREGALLDKAVTAPALQELQRASEIAYAAHVGLEGENYIALCECLTRHADMLDAIRQKQLHRYLNGSDSDNVNAIQGKPTLTRYDGGEA